MFKWRTTPRVPKEVHLGFSLFLMAQRCFILAVLDTTTKCKKIYENISKANIDSDMKILELKGEKISDLVRGS